MLEIKPTKLAGCFEMQSKVLEDIRGHFVKVFHTKEFAAHGLETNFVEEYYSVSSKNVIRGMHFQTPPMEHVKVVYCVQGSVLDVTVDLRVGSPTYGQNFVIELNSAKRISGELTNTDIVMNNTFWIGVQPSLTKEMLEYAAVQIEAYLGFGF